MRHTVAEGENIWSLARSFRVPVSAIMSANGLTRQSAANIRPGTRLRIPGVYRDGNGRVQRERSRAPRSATIRARRLRLGSRQVGQDLLHGRVRPEWVTEVSRGFGRHRFPGTLRWPVTNGWFVRGFGSGPRRLPPGGRHHGPPRLERQSVRARAGGLLRRPAARLRQHRAADPSGRLGHLVRAQLRELGASRARSCRQGR